METMNIVLPRLRHFHVTFFKDWPALSPSRCQKWSLPFGTRRANELKNKLSKTRTREVDMFHFADKIKSGKTDVRCAFEQAAFEAGCYSVSNNLLSGAFGEKVFSVGLPVNLISGKFPGCACGYALVTEVFEDA